ncbi:MAG: HlyC/CorC family transporter [Acidobacteria bacterium]|uniref:HlyC/CorC family transporter n=1 Tax=Candidatus Polarisedimenticola svalbardensis TaxID=2886004 RepID=A0A8J6Y4I3_9BACT|nr:HlyC/CorC family transporter [Candidatus Polarisedimenticola svalbardensis]
MKDLLYLLVALALVVLNGFFVAAEFALVKVRATRMKEMADDGSRPAVMVLDILPQLDAYLSACQIGITIASLGLGWIGEPAFAHLLEPLFTGFGRWSGVASHTIAVPLAFVIITVLHITLGELVPKIIAIRQAEKLAVWVAWPMRLFYLLLYPAIWLLNGCALILVKWFGFKEAEGSDSALSKQELKQVLVGSRAEGYLSDSQTEILRKTLEFPGHIVRQIMVPRTDMVALDVNDPFEDNFRTLCNSVHTRYPLYEDSQDNIVGILHLKSLLPVLDRNGPSPDIRAFAHEAQFVPESLPIARLLTLFQEEKSHLAIVIDEYGGTSGIVTLEDVIEELLGEIQDEFDREEPMVVPLDLGKISVDAALPVDDLKERIGLVPDQEPDVDTLGGLVMTRLGRIARVGDSVVIGERRIDVSRVSGRRIVRLIVHPARKESGPDERDGDRKGPLPT